MWYNIIAEKMNGNNTDVDFTFANVIRRINIGIASALNNILSGDVQNNVSIASNAIHKIGPLDAILQGKQAHGTWLNS